MQGIVQTGEGGGGVTKVGGEGVVLLGKGYGQHALEKELTVAWG